eukprot:TRINITY_DN22000_c0_g1_i1.p1 TRINITY_DN22000_c0_g1~~TRINITY_DN22000_c0_g1_i1.p1  ORF type:complete len:190 (-),score=62.61 TRINITY_DN22000_c0_g1_i1:456-1025(-)
MYLNRVLADINRESAALNPEHLYKLNEAIFNLPDDDNVDSKCAKRIFEVVQLIRKKYKGGKIIDPENNFYYDYVALLGTLQNQHFFSSQQTDSVLSWVKEAIEEDLYGDVEEEPVVSRGGEEKLATLKEENAKLQRELEKLRSVSEAVEILQSFGLPRVDAEGVTEEKAKEAAGETSKAGRRRRRRGAR